MRSVSFRGITTSSRTLAFSLAIGLLPIACSSRPAMHSEVTHGWVVDRGEHDDGAYSRWPQSRALRSGNVTMYFSVAPNRGTSPFYIYTIRSGSGRIVRTQSAFLFDIGDCVRLWHAPAAPGAAGPYDFVAGTLESGSECELPGRLP